jgi:hypothetical protein
VLAHAKSRDLLPHLALLVIAGVFLATYPQFAVDDAFIYFRYAENLALHGELNWNVGEDPVEGYTGVALPVLLALLMKAGVGPLVGGEIIGVLSFLLLYVVLALIMTRLEVPGGVRLVVLLLFVTNPVVYTHTYAGLETMLFVAMGALSFLRLLLCLDTASGNRRNEAVLLLSLLLISFVRPEGVVLSMVSIAAVGIVRAKKAPRRDFLSFMLYAFYIFVVPYAVYFLWRWNYYGLFLPNTFYAKSTTFSPESFILENLVKNARNLFGFLRAAFLIPLLAAAALLLLAPAATYRRMKAFVGALKGSRYFPAHVSVLIFVVIVVAQYVRSNLEMNYAFRFFFHLYPFLLVWLSLLMAFALQGFRERRTPLLRNAALLLLAVLGVWYARDGVSAMKGQYAWARTGRQAMEEQHVAVGKLLRGRFPREEWLVVWGDAGAMPFFSKMKTVDFGRLNDEFLTSEDVTYERGADYFYSFNPAAVVFCLKERKDLKWSPQFVESQLYFTYRPEFRRYIFYRKFLTTGVEPPGINYDYALYLYIRRDLIDDF